MNDPQYLLRPVNPLFIALSLAVALLFAQSSPREVEFRRVEEESRFDVLGRRGQVAALEVRLALVEPRVHVRCAHRAKRSDLASPSLAT